MKFKYKKSVLLSDFEKEFDFLNRKIGEIKLPPGFSEFLFYTISELFINIREHAKVNKGLIILEINDKFCSIEVSDKGIGIRNSYLAKKIFVKDDSSAIELALSGLSTKTFEERGFGLYSIRRLVEKLAGQMVIETGLTKALISKNKINFQNLSQKSSGTSIKIKTPIKKIDFYKIIA